jgi:hypothetical protein
MHSYVDKTMEYQFPFQKVIFLISKQFERSLPCKISLTNKYLLVLDGHKFHITL